MTTVITIIISLAVGFIAGVANGIYKMNKEFPRLKPPAHLKSKL
jgi:hypothetical protein